MRILLVEDTRAFAAVMTARLASFGHEVAIAENGELGVEKFIAWSPDIVWMDITMPVMGGFEAAKRIALGARGYILKPLRRAYVDGLIKNLFGRRGSRDPRGCDPRLTKTTHALKCLRI